MNSDLMWGMATLRMKALRDEADRHRVASQARTTRRARRRGR
jgi:hypothetical protein